MCITNALVTCVIPTKNRHDKLRLAIDSVLNQSYENVEVIVVDDGSDEKVENHYDSRRVTIINNKFSVGGAAARNLGIKSAKGDFICFLDDDDEYLPTKIEVMLKEFDKSTDAVVAECLLLSDGEVAFNPQTTFSGKNNFVKNKIHNNATLVRAKVFDNLSFNESLEKFQDTQFNADLCYLYKVKYIPIAVANWNLSWSTNQITTVRYRFRDFTNYFRLIKHFLFNTRAPIWLMYNHVAILLYFLIKRR
ncbi:glycosyltransferase family 2 protein [Cobetia sp. D5]|uniref:glycosyltransferase family 2 protein n=1 Tax=Cobetia sp. D5 TaxID=3105867 RepID=UPI002D784D43|nr:glycosyltransferase family 2 protein [Cobetia sp. D5]